MKEKERAEATEADRAVARSDASLHLHPLLNGARAVLFDAGGTLSHPDWERIASIAKRETGRDFVFAQMHRKFYESLCTVDARLSDETFRQAHTRRPGWGFSDMFSALDVDEEMCERLRLQLVAAHREKHVWCNLDPDVPRVMNELKRAGLRLGVISNTEDGQLKDLFEMLDIAAHFDLLVDSYIVGLRKPDAAIFHYALDQLNVAPDEAVYVGDSYGHDVMGAERAGLRAILLDPLDIYAESDCTRIQSLAELVNHAATPMSYTKVRA
jgi:HAD superfamily hydrolase (TIGR01662 family)